MKFGPRAGTGRLKQIFAETGDAEDGGAILAENGRVIDGVTLSAWRYTMYIEACFASPGSSVMWTIPWRTILEHVPQEALDEELERRRENP